MKKNEKIMIGILALILLIMIGILFFTKTNTKQNVVTNVERQSGQLIKIDQDETPNKIGRIIKVNGTLYYDTGKISENMPRCGTMDGNITSTVGKTEIPTKDGEANFEGARGYQYGRENTIEIPMEEGWVIFEAKGYSFNGVIKQVEKSCIFVEPNEGEAIRNSADLILVGIDNEALYEVGENVKVTYDGYVMETYPAQVRAINVELIKINEFTIKVYDKQLETATKVYKILDKSETNKYNYNIYAYQAAVNIIINGEEITLREALLQDKITMDEIIEKANEDFPNAQIYKDGGSKEYHYDFYTIIKCHKLDGNRDVYIGMPEMNINNI